MHTVYIGIGSNLGDRNDNIEQAVSRLHKISDIENIVVSEIYETEPVGNPDQGKFLNGVIKLDTNLSAEELLEKLLDIENVLGRLREIKNGPRTIDLDILLFDDIQINTPELIIPHPRMYEREFVLKGLRQLNPEIEI